ncbi:guanylate kinase [Acuticoccus sp. MNP-M23]|uniref:guanylate kinase n=1 Tax=Acuticoccus sp. MNP-M23 TaxID=3072793 RepID=UPI002815075E|nr:guanylate kinase [Acuticoccus sp. MNP-M23]WMS41279.1 guanylate kinase [Acuticoccus sp. MNP-M23]
MTAINRRGVLVVLSSPSGAGKSTLSRLLLDQDHGLSLSVSVTTRKRRPSEVQGIHYDFVSDAEFERMRERGELLEWAEVHGNKYATPRDPVEQALSEGRDVLFDIDWQGADQMRAAMADDLVSIFILPPSGAELQSRLVRRAEDDEATIRRRLDNAREELTHYSDYDYVVVNEDLGTALAGVTAVLAAERLRRRRLTELDGFVSDISNAL